MKNVQRSIVAILVYTCLINAPIIFCYEANMTGTLRGCDGSTNACRLTTDLIYAFGTTLLPLLLMIIFGLLTIQNVCYAQRRVQAMIGPVFNHENRNTVATTNKKKASKFTLNAFCTSDFSHPFGMSTYYPKSIFIICIQSITSIIRTGYSDPAS